MHHIIEYIKQKYDPCYIILYGSYADGTNNLNSDFDALVLSYNYEQFHDTSFVNGVQLDLFVYPVSYFDEAYDCNDFIQIFDGRIIMDSNDRGKTLQAKVLSYLQDQPQKPREEIAAGVDWCGKMLARARRNDAEGLFRWHWVLTDSLLLGFFCDVDGDPTPVLRDGELALAEWHTPEDVPADYSRISLTGEMIEQFRLGKL